jgi:O-antigen/teichoic acid export membrane protein
MRFRIFNRDIKWAYLAQALNICGGFLLLPSMIHYLSVEDVGLWFVFITMSGLAQLLDFGFQSTIIRNVAYIFAGAKFLNNTKPPSLIDPQQKVNVSLLTSLIAACQFIYILIAFIASIFLIIGGCIYINSLLLPSQSFFYSLLAWIIFAIASTLNLYYGYMGAFLQGRGNVTQYNKVVIISRSTMIILSFVALIKGFGLVGVSSAMLFSSLIGRFLILHLLKSDAITKSAFALAKYQKRMSVVKTLWHNASRIAIVQISTFIIQRSNILIASSFIGLASAASYGMTISIFIMLIGLSQAIVQLKIPKLSKIQTKKISSRSRIRKIYFEFLFFGLGTYFVGSVLIIFLGPLVFESISTTTNLLPFWQLLLLAIIFGLELNHSIATTYLTTRNSIPFLSASLISGVSMIIISLIFVEHFKIIGLIIAQGLVQLAYNNWKWPHLVSKQLGIKWIKLAYISFRRLILIYKI